MINERGKRKCNLFVNLIKYYKAITNFCNDKNDMKGYK